jgi:hypothetical protein
MATSKEISMKMTSRTFLRLAGIAAIGFAFVATPARAESLTAAFTLPYEVQWGKAVLPPGAYTMTFESRQGAALVRSSTGAGRAFVIPMTINKAMDDQPTALLVVPTEDGHDVLFLNLPEANLSFGYRLSRKPGVKVSGKLEPSEAVAAQIAQK